jgi:hypothetical protein
LGTCDLEVYEFVFETCWLKFDDVCMDQFVTRSFLEVSTF